jgi:hypothetical protein
MVDFDKLPVYELNICMPDYNEYNINFITKPSHTIYQYNKILMTNFIIKRIDYNNHFDILPFFNRFMLKNYNKKNYFTDIILDNDFKKNIKIENGKWKNV